MSEQRTGEATRVPSAAEWAKAWGISGKPGWLTSLADLIRAKQRSEAATSVQVKGTPSNLDSGVGNERGLCSADAQAKCPNCKGDGEYLADDGCPQRCGACQGTGRCRSEGQAGGPGYVTPPHCKLCAKPLAYAGATFCGAACSAEWEMGKRRPEARPYRHIMATYDVELRGSREHVLEILRIVGEQRRERDQSCGSTTANTSPASAGSSGAGSTATQLSGAGSSPKRPNDCIVGDCTKERKAWTLFCGDPHAAPSSPNAGLAFCDCYDDGVMCVLGPGCVRHRPQETQQDGGRPAGNPGSQDGSAPGTTSRAGLSSCKAGQLDPDARDCTYSWNEIQAVRNAAFEACMRVADEYGDEHMDKSSKHTGAMEDSHLDRCAAARAIRVRIRRLADQLTRKAGEP